MDFINLMLIFVSLLFISFAIYIVIFKGHRKVDDSTFAHDHIAVREAIQEQTSIEPNQEMTIERLYSSRKQRVYRYNIKENEFIVSGEVKKDSKGFMNLQLKQKN